MIYAQGHVPGDTYAPSLIGSYKAVNDLTKGGTAMSWDPPCFVEINMSAEIGGYQDDFEERAPVPADPMHREFHHTTAAKG